MRFIELLEGVQRLPTQGDLSLAVGSVREDSRRVQPGDVFVAISGTQQDGHVHIPAALAAGAAALVTEHWIDAQVPQVVVPDARAALALMAANAAGRPAQRLRLIGITGTNGKTTTAWLTEAMLRCAGRKVALLGTVANRIDGQGESATLTTPAPLELHAFFARALAAGCTDVVMEVSSHALEQRRVHGLQFHAAGFTNLTQDHLDLHGTMEAYAAAKARLFSEHLAPGGTAVINMAGGGAALMLSATSPTALRLCASLSPSAPCAVSSISAESKSEEPAVEPTLQATVLRTDLQGQSLELRSGAASAILHSPLVGGHNAENLLLAAGLGLSCGLSPAAVASGLSAVAGVPGRLESVAVGGVSNSGHGGVGTSGAGRGVAAFVDYAHTPDALQRVLALLRAACYGKLLVVFGCGGDRDALKRPIMGRIAAEIADRVVLTSDNPRSEVPAAIIEAILAGVPANLRTRVSVEPDRRSAIRMALGMACNGDALLVAGKGHEDYQIIGGMRSHFDDREELAAAGGAL